MPRKNDIMVDIQKEYIHRIEKFKRMSSIEMNETELRLLFICRVGRFLDLPSRKENAWVDLIGGKVFGLKIVYKKDVKQWKII